MTRQYAIAVALLGLAACATSVPEAADVEDEYGDYKNALICKYERVTGSSMRTRVCRTQEEIDEARAEARKVLKELDDSSIATGSD